MGKGRKNAHNGRHPQDDDHYTDYRYIYEDEYEDPLYDDEDTYAFDDDIKRQDQYPGASRANPPRRASRSTPPVYPRSRYGYQDDNQYPRRNVPPRRTTPSEPPKRLRRVKQRRRSILPGLFLGCLLGVVLVVATLAALVYLGITSIQHGGSITGVPGIPGITTQTYTQDSTQQVSLTQLQQITICDKSGNVTVQVDPTATKATITAHKTAQARTQSDANQQLQATSVEIQPPATISKPLTCKQAASQTQTTTTGTPTATTTPSSTTAALIVNVTLAKPTGNSVDLTITLPPAAVQSASPSLAVDVEAQQGNITLTGLSGVIQAHGVNGNVTISHAILASGSQIDTSQGNITFNGFLLLPTADTQQDVHYMLRNEVGDINVTLPATTNLTLDANTNVGAIKSDFKINVNNNGGPVNYHGPLNPEAGNPAAATLVLDVSTGSVHIMKASS